MRPRVVSYAEPDKAQELIQTKQASGSIPSKMVKE